MVVSTLAATAAAVLFALTTNLQRAAASSVPAAGSGPVHLVRRLVADRRWLAGGLIGVVALGLHAVALARGSVMVVQSVMALGLVIALYVEARREGRRMRAHEFAGAALVVTGVATVVAVSRPSGAPAASGGWAVAVSAAVALTALGGVLASRHRVDARWGARFLAAAGGACFAVDAVFLQRLAALLDGGLLRALGSGTELLAVAGDLVGFFGASTVGTVAVHRAYQVAPLRAVQPALAAAEPVTAFLVGATVLHEGVRGGASGYLALVGGLLAIVLGIFTGLLPAARPAARPAAAQGAGAASREAASREATAPDPAPGPSSGLPSGLPSGAGPRGGGLVDGPHRSAIVGAGTVGLDWIARRPPLVVRHAPRRDCLALTHHP